MVFGSASFSDDHTIDITSGDGNTRKITGKYIFICTGARAAVPPHHRTTGCRISDQ